jgi:hypothetical protein
MTNWVPHCGVEPVQKVANDGVGTCCQAYFRAAKVGVSPRCNCDSATITNRVALSRLIKMRPRNRSPIRRAKVGQYVVLIRASRANQTTAIRLSAPASGTDFLRRTLGARMIFLIRPVYFACYFLTCNSCRPICHCSLKKLTGLPCHAILRATTNPRRLCGLSI